MLCLLWQRFDDAILIMASFMVTSVANLLSGPMVLIFIKGPLPNLKVNHMAVHFVLSPCELEFLVIFARGQCFAVYLEVARLVPPHGQGFLLSLLFTLLALVNAKPSSLARTPSIEHVQLKSSMITMSA